MPDITATYTFTMPFHLSVIEGHAAKELVARLPQGNGQVAIRLGWDEDSPTYQIDKDQLNKWVREYNRIIVEVSMPSDSFPPSNQKEFQELAETYLVRFLKSCRHRSHQHQIDTKWKPYRFPAIYRDEATGATKESSRLRINLSPWDTQPLDDSSWHLIESDLRIGPKFEVWQDFLLDAKLYHGRHDYAMAVLSAAVVIEAVMTQYLLYKLNTTAGVGSKTQIEKFLREVSRRDLVTVGLGLVSNIKQGVREECQQVLVIRNEILHQQKRRVTAAQARDVILAAEKLISSDDIQRWLTERRTQ